MNWSNGFILNRQHVDLEVSERFDTVQITQIALKSFTVNNLYDACCMMYIHMILIPYWDLEKYHSVFNIHRGVQSFPLQTVDFQLSIIPRSLKIENPWNYI